MLTKTSDSEEARELVTGRKKAFIDAYVNDIKRRQTAAAIAAGYSEKGAAQAASRLMKDPEVAAAIEERIKELHRENTAEADEVIEFLTSVMRGEEVETVPIYCRKGIQKFTDGKPSARDKVRAAELLGKHYGLFTDKIDVGVDEESMGVVIMPEILPEEQ